MIFNPRGDSHLPNEAAEVQGQTSAWSCHRTRPSWGSDPATLSTGASLEEPRAWLPAATTTSQHEQAYGSPALASGQMEVSAPSILFPAFPNTPDPNRRSTPLHPTAGDLKPLCCAALMETTWTSDRAQAPACSNLPTHARGDTTARSSDTTAGCQDGHQFFPSLWIHSPPCDTAAPPIER